ncbi:MAG: hypothetical protein CMF61_04355 [Magnetococcales bacterium]|nr:hypothetical protein [Magnetococcales bacterium]
MNEALIHYLISMCLIGVSCFIYSRQKFYEKGSEEYKRYDKWTLLSVFVWLIYTAIFVGGNYE